MSVLVLDGPVVRRTSEAVCHQTEIAVSFLPGQDDRFPGDSEQSQPSASDGRARDLASVLYQELRTIASKQIRFEWDSRTLNTTALVNEAYIRIEGNGGMQWESRSHFLATASVVMRHVIVDYARNRKSLKRGGNVSKVSLDDAPAVMDGERADYLLALDEALERFAKMDKRGAKIVECRFFGGLTQEETAEVLGISERTVRNHWRMEKTWIRNELNNFS